MSPFASSFRPARPVLKALLMSRRSSLVASVSAAALALALLTQTGSAHAEPPVIAPPAPAATPTRMALTTTSATPMGSLMIVLDVLGIMEKEAPKLSATDADGDVPLARAPQDAALLLEPHRRQVLRGEGPPARPDGCFAPLSC